MEHAEKSSSINTDRSDELFKELELLCDKYDLSDMILLYNVDKNPQVLYTCHFYDAAKMIKTAYTGCMTKIKSEMES